MHEQGEEQRGVGVGGHRRQTPQERSHPLLRSDGRLPFLLRVCVVVVGGGGGGGGGVLALWHPSLSLPPTWAAMEKMGKDRRRKRRRRKADRRRVRLEVGGSALTSTLSLVRRRPPPPPPPPPPPRPLHFRHLRGERLNKRQGEEEERLSLGRKGGWAA